jgi:hypothetical protein
LIDTTRQWNEEERRAANSVAIKAAHGILPMRPASQAVMDSLEAFVDDPATDQRELIHAVTRMLQRREGRLEPEIQERLRQLNKRLQGSDFASRLRRFITYRVNEDDIDQKGELTARWTTEIENLAKRAVSDPALLPPELPWLVGDQTGNSLAFGLELGKLDPEERWLTPILNAQRTAADQGTVPLLAGYLGSCFHRNVARWEEIVSSLSVDPILRRFMNDVLFYSGTTERTLARAVELAEIGVLPAESFRVWGFGKRLRRFSENLLRRLLNLLLKANTFASIETSLQLCHGFYLDEEAPIQLPEDLTLKLLTHPILFSEQVAHHSYGVHCWSEIAQRFVDLYPLHSMTLLDNLLGCADDFHSLISIRKDPGPAVSARIIQQDPQGAWYRITNLLGNDLRTNQAWKIEQWLGGNYNFGEEEPGPITLFPPQLLWDWVSGNKADRALWLAKTIPLSLDPHQGGSLAREFLVRYGHEEDAANLLMARFVFRGYCGAESDHYRRLRDQGRKWLSTETDALVREWIERYIATFHERIRQAEIREERDD